MLIARFVKINGTLSKEFNGLTNNIHGLTTDVQDLINNEKYYRNLALFLVNNIKEIYFYFWQCN